MKINKFTKLKDNRYSIEFEDGYKIKLYDDVIVKYNLLVNKEMDDDFFEEVTSYNDKLDAYYKALKYITKKLRTEKEIYKYLEKDFHKDVISVTIDRLKRDGYLNKEIYIKSYLSDKINLGINGPCKLYDELLKLGFNEEEFKDKLDEIEDEVWLSKLERIISKKIKSNHQYGTYKLKEKLLYDMSNLGYYKWMIEDVISRQEFTEDSSVLEKEYTKLYSKLSRKYEGSELVYQIRNRLFAKGFSYDEVNSFVNEKKNF